MYAFVQHLITYLITSLNWLAVAFSKGLGPLLCGSLPSYRWYCAPASMRKSSGWQERNARSTYTQGHQKRSMLSYRFWLNYLFAIFIFNLNVQSLLISIIYVKDPLFRLDYKNFANQFGQIALSGNVFKKWFNKIVIKKCVVQYIERKWMVVGGSRTTGGKGSFGW